MDNLPPSDPPPPSGPPPLVMPPPRLVAAARRKASGWKTAALVLGCLLAISLIFNPLHFVRLLLRGAASPGRTAGPKLQETLVEDNDSPNKIALIPVEGIITSDFLEHGNYGMVEYIKDQL